MANETLDKKRPMRGKKDVKVLTGDAERCVCVSGSREGNKKCDLPVCEALFRDHVSRPLPTEHAEKENIAQVR